MKLFEQKPKTQAAFKPSNLQKELKDVLIRGEKVEKVYPLTENIYIFTSKRLIIQSVDVSAEGIPSCHSIPYRSITDFSLNPLKEPSTGTQLSIWLHGDPVPMQKKLESSPTIPELHRTLAEYVLNRHSPWMEKQAQWKKRAGIKTAQSLFFTGAAILTVLAIKRNHKKQNTSSQVKKLPASVIKSLIRKGLQG